MEGRLLGKTSIVPVFLFQEVSNDLFPFGKVSDWVDFFLDGVMEIAKEATDIVGKITALREKDMLNIQMLGKRASESAAHILPNLYAQPIVTVATVQKWTGFSRAGSQIAINRFVEMGLLTPRDNNKKYG